MKTDCDLLDSVDISQGISLTTVNHYTQLGRLSRLSQLKPSKSFTFKWLMHTLVKALFPL